MILDLFFDRIVILTLKGNEERAERARNELVSKNLSSKAEFYYGIRGKLCVPPVWWKSGKGSWGCLQSHLRIVQDALMDGVENLLVVEDDCVWQNNAHSLVFKFLSQLPDDWEQIYFGGQHRGKEYKPEIIQGRPAVMEGRSIHRTHCYGLKRSVMKTFTQHIMDAESYIYHFKKEAFLHIDHQLEIAHKKRLWRNYVPSFWLAGQGENKSDINGRDNPDKWWHPILPDCEDRLPIVVVSRTPDPEIMKRLHFGNHLAEDNPLIDTGLFECEEERNITIIRMIAREAYAHQRLPAMFFHPLKVEYFKENWPAGVIMAKDLTAEKIAAICDYPASGVIKHPWLNP